ncbi:hypothetical protein IFM89_039691 [Coptis chinensis]|uniref:RRM domain-containing protein n=1 Tax=Coptis chinensis TaxID=261450 RepID=A0A835GXL9_9MAGN|nr:hypothetical protein IFM89_039691 [Coptis chinensis]
MAVVENGAPELSSNRNLETSADSNKDLDHQSKQQLNPPPPPPPKLQQQNNMNPILRPHSDQNFQIMQQQQMMMMMMPHVNSPNGFQMTMNPNSGFHHRSNSHDVQQQRSGGEMVVNNNGFKRDMRELEELLSKLNPMAEEFVPPSLTNNNHISAGAFYANNFLMFNHHNIHETGAVLDIPNGHGPPRRKKNNYNQGKRRINSRTSIAQREDVIRRTVYVSDIDHQVTEEQLAALFVNCGQVVDCRICGDPNSVLRFAFIEFTDEEGARASLSLAGTMLGYYPVRVLPSKTAIAPVNPTFLPRSEDEREMCARTIYCTNIDKKVSQADVKLFFESICGAVYRLRLLGDYHHSTRIAFVEFIMAESAIAALNCSGVILGSLPIRVSPSKTPVRPRAPRPHMH